MSKYFTHFEAETLLPRISALVQDAVDLKAEYQAAEASLDSVLQRIALMGGILPDQKGALAARSARQRSGERLKAVLEEIQECGCLIKDLDVGLVDFPTLLRGEEVYLCWKIGEPGIQFWHSVHEGFAGRKPIDQDFLDHHQGNAAQ